MATKPPVEVPQGAIRLNTDSQKLEFYAQDQWWEMATDISTLNGGTRGLIAGGSCPTFINSIGYINIATTGNAADFGDLTVARESATCAASRTRGLFAGGYHPGAGDDEIDYITFATTGDAIDFGNLTGTQYAPAGVSNETRGVWGGGTPAQSLIQYVTIATLGNSIDFGGDLTVSRRYAGSVASCTRGVFGGGDNQPTSSPGIAAGNVIDYITIASTGHNASDFGDLIQATHMGTGSASNSIRGIFSCGMTGWAPTWPSSTVTNYITIATLGNATTFGDLTQARGYSGGCASPTRFCTGGGFGGPSPTRYNNIDYATIATTGNFVDFGDLLDTQTAPAATSNGHGGL